MKPLDLSQFRSGGELFTLAEKINEIVEYLNLPIISKRKASVLMVDKEQESKEKASTIEEENSFIEGCCPCGRIMPVSEKCTCLCHQKSEYCKKCKDWHEAEPTKPCFCPCHQKSEKECDELCIPEDGLHFMDCPKHYKNIKKSPAEQEESQNIARIEDIAKMEERQRIGEELWEWFNEENGETYEEGIFKITGVKNPKL